MSHYLIRQDLSKLKHAVKKIKLDDGRETTVVILDGPSNNLFFGEKGGIYLDMIAWFDGVRFDDSCQKEYIEWFNKLVSENIKQMKSSDVNSDLFKSAYMFLYNIKNHLENCK